MIPPFNRLFHYPFTQACLFSAGLLLLPFPAPSAQVDSVSDSGSGSLISIASLSTDDYQWIGQRIYQNECAGQPRYLTHWGKGEEFPSLGIGHFIWLPKGVEVPFEQTFPKLFDFVSASKPAPAWLEVLRKQSGSSADFYAPWSNRQQFEQAWSSSELSSLRDWLLQTQELQARFIVQSFEARWDKALQSLDSHEQQILTQELSKLTAFKQGQFAVIDYFNFKGIGGNSKEQYQGEGWGLIEVLHNLNRNYDSASLNETQRLQAFVDSAKQRLELRVKLAPKERKESRWITGWFKRLDGYLMNE
ncbi:hypothetical protein QCB44_04425 [Thiomicrorhabdus sp. zzn3]|uniref:hypothetical protein n=1 Tax=Thiomicrorhabdus sp. zzn3 TaxID=3039775 RepID=UPI002436C16F|nr:hypothetical protein [Thiomicrorhabdus sp. zzn3]MDG6777949.1 hypothetical protein [Thiomicrorhabdus sp. zzn3]